MKKENKNESAFDRLGKIISETDKESPYILICEENNEIKGMIKGTNGDLKALVGAFFVEKMILGGDKIYYEIFADGIKSVVKLLAEKYGESKKNEN
jgi:hypothetical protein